MKLRMIVADLSLDEEMPQDASVENFEACLKVQAG